MLITTLFFSLNVKAETRGPLFAYFGHDLVVLGAQLVIVILLELRPCAVLLQLFLLVLAQLVQLRRHLALEDELLHLLFVFFAHVGRVGWVLSLQEDGEELQHGLFAGKGGVLQTVFTDLSKAASNNRAQGLLHESDGGLFPL